jgi:hypothetical protein
MRGGTFTEIQYVLEEVRTPLEPRTRETVVYFGDACP